MKIKQKLTLGFISIALLTAVVGYISVNVSQRVLQKSVGQTSATLAKEILEHIDMCICNRIESFQEYKKDTRTHIIISESNREFEKLDNIQNYIDEQEHRWTSVPKEEITAFMHKLMDNRLSEKLREKLDFYEEKDGYKVFGEAFVTNKYGANAAQTGKTSDYYQADEKWWQEAKKDGLYVSDVEYDKSADIYSIDICIRNDDEAGNFLGITKIALNIEETVNLIKDVETEAVQFKLLTKNGRVIYATEGYETLEPLPEQLLLHFFKGKRGEHRHYFIAAGDNPDKGDRLFAHAHSEGYKDYKGLGWILVTRQETKQIFVSIIKLRNQILTASLAITALAVITGLVISRSISGPIGKLSVAVARIGKGNLDSRVEIESNDEVGQLAASFNMMTEDLSKTTASRNELDAANQQLRASEQQLKAINQQLTAKEQQLLSLNHNLNERVKEINCLYSISKIVETNNDSLDKILHDVVNVIPPSGQYPEITCARISVNGRQFTTPNFKQTQWKQTSDIMVNNKKSGSLEVCHLEQCPESDEGSFLAEERALIDAITEQLGRVIEYMRANEDIKHAQKEAEAANRSKSQFLANMSHEIRTPMNAIMGFGELLSAEELTDQQRDHVNTICSSGKHLLQVIDGILDFSKIEAGKLDVELEECSLGNLLGVIESITHPLTTGKDLKFEIRENNGLPANIRTDQARIQQCLINLVNNAIKFTEKGHVYVEVSLEDKDNQPYIRFDVEDTGIGIPPERQEKIFELFTQADGSTSRKYGGTGLGLAITRQLTELLGGKLTLTSEEDKGSMFSIVIPAGLDVTKQPLLDRYDIASHTNITKEQIEQAEFSGHILVAEDIKNNQKLIKSLLERFGFQVTIAEDGNQAIQKVLEQSFDLVFMDIQMPNVNGYEATRTLRNKGVKTPIIALTANAMKSDDKKCIEAGCDAYLSKPIGHEKLLRMIRKYFSEKNETVREKIDTIKSQVDELSHTVVDTVFAKDKSEPQPAQNTSEEKIIDWADLLGRCGDAELAKEVVESFLVDNPEIVHALRDSVRAVDSETVKSQAHILKGSAKAIGATPLSQAALELELAAREQNFEVAESLLTEIEAEFEKITSLLSQPDWIEVMEQQCNKHLKS